MTFEQHIIEKYRRSVFEIELEVAMTTVAFLSNVTHKEAASEAWARADAFMDELRLREPIAGPSRP
jgi:hypothetical protein